MNRIRMNRWSIPALAAAVSAAGLGLGALVPACAAASAPQEHPRPEKAAAERRVEDLPKLTVRGDAVLERPADRLLLQVGVVTEHAEASSALADNSRQMDGVVKAITKAGLGPDEYQTGRFDLQPVYSERPPRTASEWRPQIVAYRVTNTVRIKTVKLQLAGELIRAAYEAGANTIDSIGFDLADPRKHRAEAIRQATANALEDARVLSEASGLRLVRVLSISLDPDQYWPVVMQGRGMAGMAAAEAVTPPIAPGDVTVRAGVSVVYEIAPREAP